MNTLLVFTVLFAGACMADVSHIVDHKPQIAILENVQDAGPDGSFHNSYKTENGIYAGSEGRPDLEQQGRYQYTSPEGQLIEVTWTAGVNGFKAVGAVVPEYPDHVVRSLAYNAEHPYKEPTSP